MSQGDDTKRTQRIDLEPLAVLTKETGVGWKPKRTSAGDGAALVLRRHTDTVQDPMTMALLAEAARNKTMSVPVISTALPDRIPESVDTAMDEAADPDAEAPRLSEATHRRTRLRAPHPG